VHTISMLIASGTALLAATASLAPARAAEPVRNVVLVHGAFADGSGWQPVFERLVKKGYRVSVVQEPETSLAEDVAATRRVIELIDGPVVLVGHSWGGQIITEAGTDDKVKALVYVAGIMPEVGETTAELHARFPAAGKDNVKEVSGGYLMIDPEHLPEDFAADLPKVQAEFMAQSQVLIHKDALATPAKAAAWKDKPTFAMVATKDRTINPELERWMYKRANAKVTEVDSSHVIMISHPDKVVAVIEEAAAK
jgi:pimeloyl-ACP methyl ester carboxylesterase